MTRASAHHLMESSISKIMEVAADNARLHGEFMDYAPSFIGKPEQLEELLRAIFEFSNKLTSNHEILADIFSKLVSGTEDCINKGGCKCGMA